MDSIEYGCANTEDIAYMDALDKTLQDNPNDFDTLLKKGIFSYYPFHRDEEAEAIFYSLIEKQPMNTDVYFWFGECLFGYTSNYETAELMLRKALTINPNRADCHKVLASTLDILNRDTNEVAFHYRKAVELEPSWPAPRKYLAYTLFKQGNFEQARCESEKIIALYPNNFKCPHDLILENYEELTTGRANNGILEEIIKFMKKVDAAIAEKNKHT